MIAWNDRIVKGAVKKFENRKPEFEHMKYNKSVKNITVIFIKM